MKTAAPDTTEWKIAFNTIHNSLDGLSIDEASKKLSDLKLDTKISKHILTDASKNKLINGSADEIAKGIENFKGAPSIISKTESSVSNLGSVFTGLGKTVKSGFSSILSFITANPLVVGIAAAATAIAVIATIIDASVESYDEANEKAKESANAYKEVQGAVESLRTELETTKERIKELQALQDAGTITAVEEQELANLKIKNKELEQELGIKKKLADLKLQEANDDAINALGKKDTSLATKYDEQGNKGKTGTSLTDADALEKSIKKVEQYKTKITTLEEKQKSVSTKLEKDSIQKEIDKYKNAITDLETDMNTRAQNISDHLENVADKTSAVYIENSKVLNKYLSHDLPETEKQLANITDYFESSSTNSIKDKLLEAAKSGISATDALHEMGITLNDLGITGENKKKVFDNYFSEMVKSANQAEKSIKAVDGSIEGVKTAFESENQDASWNTMGDYLKQAQELYDNGKIGTDDFQAATQFITPTIINTDASNHDADAYAKAWKNAQEKIKRYFDTEKPLESVTNFSNDLVSNGLAHKVGETFIWSFKNSAEAADKLNLSIQATEALMHNLESYGAEFDEIMWSGEALDKYKTSVKGLQALYTSIQDVNLKKNLDSLIDFDSLNEELEKYENDLSLLTQDQVVKIEFVYDVATLKAEIATLIDEISTSGGSTEQWGTLNAKQKSYNDKLASSEGMSDATISEEYQKTEEKYAELSKKLRDEYKTLGEDGRRELQMQQNAILQLQNAYLEAFSQGTVKDWDEFIQSSSAVTALNSIKETTGLTAASIQELLGVDFEIVPIIKMPDFTKQPLIPNTTIIYDANVEGVQTAVNCITTPNSTIIFQADVNGVTKTLSPILSADGSINYKIKSQELPKDKEAGVAYSFTGWFNTPVQFPYFTTQPIGVARANGTLNRNYTLNNKWKTTKAETALTGELGQELIVHGNRWWTVGDHGAEFSHIPPNSVIFNAQQTKELLSKGFTNSRGRARLHGTAYANGSTDSKESFNWIETALSRMQHAINNFGKTLSATYKSWSDRDNALNQELSAINNEISIQEQARNTYLEKAKSVGLPSKYQDLVEKGAIQIDEISNENLKEQIKSYQEWYEKALDCDDKIQDLNDELAKLAKTNFDNVAKQFDNILYDIEHQTSMLDSYIDLAESRGYMASSQYYTSLMENEQQNIESLEKKYSALTTALTEAMNTGKIQEGSEAWYEMTSSINSVEESLIDAQISLAEYGNALRELEWDKYDKLQDKISQITEETEFLIDILSNEDLFDSTGNMTEYGQATLGLHVTNIDTYQAQISKYKEELEKVQKELADNPFNQDLVDHEQKLEGKIRETILAINDEKNAIKDLYSEGYDALLDNMSNVIDKRKELLSQAKEQYDYEKNIAEQIKEIAILEKQLSAYQGDTSEESRAKIQEIKVSLEEARDNLEETEYDKYISDQEQMLDSLYDETKEWVNNRLDNVDLLIEKAIESARTNSESIMETLQKATGDVGTALSDKMNEIWSSNGTIGTAMAAIEKYFADMQVAAEKQASKDIEASSQPDTPAPNTSLATSTTTTSSETASSWGSWFITKKDSYAKHKLNKETSIVDRLKYNDIDSSFSARANYYKAMGGSGTYTGSSSQNQWMLTQMKANRFAKGGIVGNLIRKSGEDGFALVRKGEGIIPIDMMPQWEQLVQNLHPLNQILNATNNIRLSEPTKTANHNVVNHNTFEFHMPNVTNGEETITYLQHSKRFENIIHEISFGKNSLSKYKY